MTAISFADFELDPRIFELRRKGRLVPVERRVFDLIHFLILNRERVVYKEELFAELWNGRAVSKASLSVAIAAARKALADTPQHQGAIRTSRGRGYQFVAQLNNPLRPSEPAHKLPHVVHAVPHPFVGREPELRTMLAALEL